MQGGILDGTAVQALLDRIQRNPFAADTTLSAVPGADISVANLIYQIPDRRAWQTTLGYANDGVPPLGSSRFRLATLWGNALDTGSLVGAELSMGEDVDSYLAQSLSCTVPLAWDHEISLSAVHAATELEIIDAGELVDVGGDAWLASLRYTIPWRSSLTWKHQVHLGLDYKQFDTDLTFGGLGTFSQPLETSAFVVGASSSFARSDISAGMSLEAAWSPGGLFSNDNDADYQAIVTGADSQYLILRAGLWGKWEMPQEWTLQGRVSGQWADTPLLPSEEASIAGMSAVRGYEERSILGRHAVWGAVELFTPPLPLPLTSRKPVRLLAFLDAGKAWVSAAAEQDQTALAMGVGLHMAWNGCQLRCEAAWPLHDASEHPEENQDQEMRVHISASLAF
jgi:hemolysin activation/secretion protein